MDGRAATIEVMVVGEGSAGLATTRELGRLAITAVVLEAGDTVGWSWRRYHESLVLHTGRRLSAVPWQSFGRAGGLAAERVHAFMAQPA